MTSLVLVWNILIPRGISLFPVTDQGCVPRHPISKVVIAIAFTDVVLLQPIFRINDWNWVFRRHLIAIMRYLPGGHLHWSHISLVCYFSVLYFKRHCLLCSDVPSSNCINPAHFVLLFTHECLITWHPNFTNFPNWRCTYTPPHNSSSCHRTVAEIVYFILNWHWEFKSNPCIFIPYW